MDKGKITIDGRDYTTVQMLSDTYGFNVITIRSDLEMFEARTIKISKQTFYDLEDLEDLIKYYTLKNKVKGK